MGSKVIKANFSYDELPFLVCNISLQTEDGQDMTMVLDPMSGEAVSMIYGGLVATAAEMVDQAGSPGIYFVFPDVSIRYVGRFRIEGNVLRMTRLGMRLIKLTAVAERSTLATPILSTLSRIMTTSRQVSALTNIADQKR